MKIGDLKTISKRVF